MDLLKVNEGDDFELSAEQKKELDLRLEKHENGEMKFSSWDAVKDRIRNNAKSKV